MFGTHHASAIASAPGAELAAIAVKSPESQQSAKAAHPQCDVYGNYHKLLAREDIDVVDIVVPNQLHHEVGMAAITAGKHVLLEKPLANKDAHCRELVDAAKQRNIVLAVNHELRLSSLWGGVKRLIDDGAIGRPLHALIELSRFPYRQGSDGWRYDIDRVGNWILEEPIHFFDLARWWLGGNGDPTSVYARANSRQPDRPELNDNFSAIVNFPQEAYAVVSQTLSAFGHHVTGKVAGEKGTIWAQWSGADARSDQVSFSLRWGLGDEIREEKLDKPAGELLELADQIAAMTACVRDGAAAPCTGRDGLWSAKLCLAAQRSVDEQKIVEFSG